MIQNLHFQYPTWFLLLCLLLGVAYALFLYIKEVKFDEAPKWTKPVLGILRALSVAIIASLLLSPFIKSIKEDAKQPIVIIAQDQSSSISAELSSEEQARLISDIKALDQKLSEKFETKTIRFGEKIEEGLVDSFSHQVTNLSSLMSYVNDNYADQNVGAMVIVSDGIFNEGKNPIYSKLNMSSPIYTLALGDTTRRKDILVKNVFHNKIAYLGDKFTIQADVQAINAKGANSKISVKQVGAGGKTIEEKILRIDGDDYFTTHDIVLEADQTGNVKYRISVIGINNEISKVNNYKDIFIEVLDARQKILILANAPHPDLGALKQLITNNKNYEVDIKYPQDSDYTLNQYNVVVMHNLPSTQNNVAAELDLINKRNIPTLYVVGSQTDLTALNRVQSVLKVTGNSNSLEEIQADVNQSFTQFTTSLELKRKLGQFPPLVAPFGKYELSPTASSLIAQKINKINTDYPLIAYSNGEGKRQATLVGEGVWKWRLYNYLQHDNYEIVEELIGKSIQYLSVKDDKRKFRSSTSKNIYKENESIIVDAQLYNDNYELINDPETSITITDSAGKEYNYIFNRTQNFYTLDAGRFAEGNYRYTSRTNLSGSTQEVKGRFSVQSIQLENFDLTARHSVLRSLSDKYGGKLVYQDGIAALGDELLNSDKIKPIIFQTSKTESIMNLRWLFFILAGLLIIEWFIRRYMGSY